MTMKHTATTKSSVPGSRVIKRAEFAYFDWSSLSVGDTIEGMGTVDTDVERMLFQETVPQLMLDCLQELSTMDDEPAERERKMIKLAGRR